MAATAMAATTTMAATAMTTTTMATMATMATAAMATNAMAATVVTKRVIAIMKGDLAVLAIAEVMITTVVVPADKEVPLDPGVTIERLVAQIGRF
jgi:hypothetical protein